MAILQSSQAKGISPNPYPHTASSVCAVRATIALTANPTANDIAEMVMLPAGCRVIDMILDSDDLDSDGTPAITMDVGIMSGEFGTSGARTCGDEFFTAATVGQTGAVARPTKKEAFRVAASNVHRSIGIKFAVVSDVFVAGTVGLTVLIGAA